jgi:phosphodiesterase/alkaline phosphatase D-like protein
MNFVAVTLDEFRDNWKYNHGDEKMQAFLSKVPIFSQWDDHEVSTNCIRDLTLQVTLQTALNLNIYVGGKQLVAG